MYWKLPQGGQLNKLTQLSSKLPIPTLDSEVFPPCTAPAQGCTYVHKYAHSGVHSTRITESPARETVRKPINSETDKGWHVHTVGCHTGRGRANRSCMEQGRWMSQRKDVGHQIAYCLPEDVMNKLHTTSFSLQHKTKVSRFTNETPAAQRAWVPCLHPLVADNVLLPIFQRDWVTNRSLLCKLEFPPNWTPEIVH